MSVEVLNFGCRLNAYESEVIKKSATDAGLHDTIILNSCAVTEEAERQLRQAIRKAKKTHPEKKIIVTGCAAQLSPDQYNQMPEVDFVIGNVEKTQKSSYENLNHNKTLQISDIMQLKEAASSYVESFDGRSRAFLEIQNGCNHRCTFCIIPYARGNNRSVPENIIIKNINNLIENGFSEIVLTGVDISDYGKDIGSSLGQLVTNILSEAKDLKRLRFSSLDVAEIDSALLSLILENDRIMPHLHLSVQAGDDMILKRMKRRHLRKNIIDFTKLAHSHRPEIAFGADLIAGFPTETEEMFRNTFNLIEEAKLVYLHVFPYSSRKDTPASKMPQVPLNIRKTRAKLLRDEGNKNLLAHYNKHIDTALEVLVENSGFARATDFSLIKICPSHVPNSLIYVKPHSINNKFLDAS